MRFLKHEKFRIISILIILIFIYILIYKPHTEYAYPLHSDEWYHLSRAIFITDNQIPPERAFPIVQKFGENLEMGFHAFLAVLFKITGLDPITAYKFFPALFAVLAAFSLFLLIYKTTSDFLAGVLAMFFFASLRTNVTFLGTWFLVPLTFCFFLLFLFIYSFFKALHNNDKRFMAIYILLSLAIAPSHPPTIILAYLICFIYALVKFRLSIKNHKVLLPFFLIPIIITLLFMNFFWKGNIIDSGVEFLRFATFEVDAGVPPIRFPIMEVYGGRLFGFLISNSLLNFTIGGLLAIIALPVVLYKKREIFAIWLLIPILLIQFFYIYKTSILFQYARLVYFSFLALAALSAIGLSSIINFSYQRFKEYFGEEERVKALFLITSACIVGLIFYFVFQGYYDPSITSKLYQNINNDDYNAIQFISTNYGEHNIVLALPQISSAVYPLSKNYVVSTALKTVFAGKDFRGVIEFFQTGEDCEYKMSLVKMNKVDLVLSKRKIKCNFLKEVYNKDDYVYEVIKNN